MLPPNFPARFFNPLASSRHREDYIHVLTDLETVLKDSGKIAMPRVALLSELRRRFRREQYQLDVSDEEDYDEESSGDLEQDNLAFMLRAFRRSGWIDVDETGDYASDTVFLTQYGKQLTEFLRSLARTEDQSGFVVNTISNLRQVREMPENGLVCIRNAYESTQRLISSLEMGYAHIKQYYTDLLERNTPEELLQGHFNGYIQEVVDRVIFPLKVDDSASRFRGQILDAVRSILEDSTLLDQIVDAALQVRRIPSAEDGRDEILTSLNYIERMFNDIESYTEQLDEKNQSYIRSTRQKLTYMLSHDTSFKGKLASLLSSLGNYLPEKPKRGPARKQASSGAGPEEAADDDDAGSGENWHLEEGADSEGIWESICSCFNFYDVQQIMDDSVYHPRKRKSRNREDPLDIELPEAVSQEAALAAIDTRAARYVVREVNQYVDQLLGDRTSMGSEELDLQDDEDYLMAIYIVLNSTDRNAIYQLTGYAEDVQAEQSLAEAAAGWERGLSLQKGQYSIPSFVIQRKESRR